MMYDVYLHYSSRDTKKNIIPPASFTGLIFFFCSGTLSVQKLFPPISLGTNQQRNIFSRPLSPPTDRGRERLLFFPLVCEYYHSLFPLFSPSLLIVNARM